MISSRLTLETGYTSAWGDKRHRILALNTLVVTGEVEIECEGVD
jgi:hypothetical protein